jgi:zinc and cadmium transporter
MQYNMTNEIWINTLVSTLVVCVASFAGVLFLAFKMKLLQRIVFVLVSFAVGALFGNAFFLAIPESQEMLGNNLQVGLFVVGGILLMFVVEKLIHWQHNHNVDQIKDKAPLGYISLFADGVHNFIDGILIASSWMVSPEIGLATTLAVIAHEIPQEISDFGILIHAGFSRKRALFFNFLSACTAVLGALGTLWIGGEFVNVSGYILPFAAGGFIYLAGSDLIPELHREKSTRKNLLQFVVIIIGLALMLFIGQNHKHHHGHEHGQHTEECEHGHIH